MNHRLCVFSASVVLALAAGLLAPSASAQPGGFGEGEVQRQHDLNVKGEMDRLSKYHNNADDYPKAGDDAAWVKK